MIKEQNTMNKNTMTDKELLDKLRVSPYNKLMNEISDLTATLQRALHESPGVFEVTDDNGDLEVTTDTGNIYLVQLLNITETGRYTV